jgi:hypothetical protein
VFLVGAAFLSLRAGGQTAGQTASQPPAKKELMAEDVYKNIQVLKGVPENQFLATIGFFCRVDRRKLRILP